MTVTVFNTKVTGANRYREGGISESSVIFPNDVADMFNRESVRENSFMTYSEILSNLIRGIISLIILIKPVLM